MNGNSNGNAVIASDLRKLFKMKKYVKIFQNEKVAFEMNKGLSLSHKYSTMQPVYFLPFSLLIILIMTLIGIRKSPKFPKIHSVNVLFRERFLSGKSSGIMRTYQNALEVVLTEQELWIRPFFLLFPFPLSSFFYCSAVETPKKSRPRDLLCASPTFNDVTPSFHEVIC